MPGNLNKLKNNILNDIFRKEVPNPSMTNFAKQLSGAYKSYTEDIITFAGDSLVSFGNSNMETKLLDLDSQGNTASFVGLIIEAAIIEFWNHAAFAVGTPPPGFSTETSITITPPSPGPLQAAIIAALAVENGDESQALLWATGIHNLTMTIKTTHSGLDTTTPTPLPKTVSNQPIS